MSVPPGHAFPQAFRSAEALPWDFLKEATMLTPNTWIFSESELLLGFSLSIFAIPESKISALKLPL